MTTSRRGLDIWLYFLRHAATIDTEAVPEVLRQPLVVRALEELGMLTQTDLERERYESRRKAQLDYNTGLKVARMEGREEGRQEGREEGRHEGREKGREEGREKGREEGKAIGVINFLERLLNRPETSPQKLEQMSLEELTKIRDELQRLFSKP